jgi:AcrR family transcriptional regulator
MAPRISPGDLESAAAALADERGIDAVTVTSVAQRLGVRGPSLYAHVSDRAELLERLSVHALGRLADELAVALAGLGGRDALAAFADTHRRFADESPGLWSALQRPLSASAAAESDGRRIVALTHGALRGYRLPDDDLVHAVRVLGATVNGFVSLQRSGGFSHSTPGPEVSWERALDALDALFRAWPADGPTTEAGEASR